MLQLLMICIKKIQLGVWAFKEKHSVRGEDHQVGLFSNNLNRDYSFIYILTTFIEIVLILILKYQGRLWPWPQEGDNQKVLQREGED